MLDQTFQTPLAADLVAVAAGSLQGALFAAGFKRIDLLGVAFIGVATGIGGGLLRDMLLGTTPAAFSNNLYLIVSIGAALLGMLLPRVFRRLDPFISALDAIGIGMFGAIGTTKALAMGLPIVPSLFIGVVSAVGGGALRDVMLNLPIAVMHVGSLYAVASLVGVSVLTVLLAFDVPVVICGVVCVVVTTAVRLLAVRFGWSLPEQRALSRVKLRRQRQVEQVIDEALQTGAITLPIVLPDPDPAAAHDTDDAPSAADDAGDDSEAGGPPPGRPRRPRR